MPIPQNDQIALCVCLCVCVRARTFLNCMRSF